jgi:lactate racemase
MDAVKDSKVRFHYGKEVWDHQLPSGWNLLGNMQTQYLPPIGSAEIQKTLDNPTGAPRLEELARGRKNAVIVAGDVTRPAQGEVALPLILNALNRGGIPDARIQLVMGGGSHEPPRDLPQAYERKYGKEVAGRLKILYHNPDQDLAILGKTKKGHVVEINKWVAEAELKIGFGGILPHVFGGYSGGAKCILPGVASRETMIQNHLMIADPGVGLGLVEGNPVREEMEEVGEIAGLDFIFNFVINTEAEPVGAVCGDFRQAYRQGVALGRKVFQAELPRPAQVVFSSGFPFDIHFYQSLNGPCSVLNACQDGGTIIHVTPCYEGIRSGTKKLFSTIKTIGYKDLFARLKAGERKDESIRSFFYPEINIGVGMTISRAMVDRHIRIVVVTEGAESQELREMGFEHTRTLPEAIDLVHKRIPQADVAAALNAKVIVTLAN